MGKKKANLVKAYRQHVAYHTRELYRTVLVICKVLCLRDKQNTGYSWICIGLDQICFFFFYPFCFSFLLKELPFIWRKM